MATTPSGPKEQAARTAAAPEDLRRKWIFLNRIRQDDAFNDWLNRTMLTDDNQLGIVVSSPLTAKELSSRVEQLLKRLAAPSPGETLILKAYAPGKPLRLLGTGTRHGENGAFSWTPAP